MLRLTDDTSIYTAQWASRKLHYLKMTENQTLFLSDNYIMLVGHNIWYLIFNLPPSPQCHRYLIHSLWLWIFDFEKSILHWNHVPCHPNLLSLNNVHIKCAFIYFYRYTLWKKNVAREIFSPIKSSFECLTSVHSHTRSSKHKNLNYIWWNSENFVEY